MKTLAIVAQKGGAGKTTLAVHLAVCAHQAGLRAALVDLDPQASAAGWNESRAEDRQLDVIAAPAESLASLKRQAEAGGADLLILDTAPHSNRAAGIAAQLADLILIPCRPARFDLNALATTRSIAELARKPAAILLNAVPPRSRIGQEAAEGLAEQGAEVCPVQLTRRAAYEHAVIDGRAVHEYEPQGAAAAEIDRLFDWLRKRLDLKKPRRRKT